MTQLFQAQRQPAQILANPVHDMGFEQDIIVGCSDRCSMLAFTLDISVNVFANLVGFRVIPYDFASNAGLGYTALKPKCIKRVLMKGKNPGADRTCRAGVA